MLAVLFEAVFFILLMVFHKFVDPDSRLTLKVDSDLCDSLNGPN
jgi:hypothetical protein